MFRPKSSNCELGERISNPQSKILDFEKNKGENEIGPSKMLKFSDRHYVAGLLQLERNSVDTLGLANMLIQAEVTSHCGQPRMREGKKCQR